MLCWRTLCESCEVCEGCTRYISSPASWIYPWITCRHTPLGRLPDVSVVSVVPDPRRRVLRGYSATPASRGHAAVRRDASASRFAAGAAAPFNASAVLAPRVGRAAPLSGWNRTGPLPRTLARTLAPGAVHGTRFEPYRYGPVRGGANTAALVARDVWLDAARLAAVAH